VAFGYYDIDVSVATLVRHIVHPHGQVRPLVSFRYDAAGDESQSGPRRGGRLVSGYSNAVESALNGTPQLTRNLMSAFA
jgi:hypothetical protein